MKNNVIYKIVNIKTNKMYVGRTMYPDKRRKRHLSELRKGKHHCLYLQRSFNKYGEENFTFEIIEENLTDSEAVEREQFYLDNMDNLYNINPNASCGGDLISNNPNREEIIEKISEGLRKRYEKMTPEERLELSLNATGEKNPNYGNKKEKSPLYKKPKSKSHRENISKAKKGKKLSKEHIEKMRKSKKGSIPWNKGKRQVHCLMNINLNF